MKATKKVKKLIIAAMFITNCSTSNKVGVVTNKYGPVHYMKYKEVNGKFFVQGREVKLLPGTCLYANKK